MTEPSGPDLLQHPLGDAITVCLFGGVGALLEVALWPVPTDLMAATGALVVTLGPLGCAIERGVDRPLSWAAGGGLASLGVLVYLSSLYALGLSSSPAGWVARAATALVLGALLTRLGPRLDRGEAGWREAARLGPPTGTSPLALRITSWRPGPIRWLEWAALPVSWLARLPCLLAIRLYQLTLSRLMPPACQFEPTCSRYGFSAFWRHGLLRGFLLTGLRIVRCSPLSGGGLDPVPPRSSAPACRTSRLSCAHSPESPGEARSAGRAASGPASYGDPSD